MSTTATKGRPTPKAPQNRPRPQAEPVEPNTRRFTPAEQARAEAVARYKAHRRETRPFRRAFGGCQRSLGQTAVDALKRYVRDAEHVRPLADQGDPADRIARKLCLPESRVRHVLKTMGGRS